jgi:hypothetical protein
MLTDRTRPAASVIFLNEFKTNFWNEFEEETK